MDPVLLRKQLEPLIKYDKYNLKEILEICYPLRGIWDWSMIDNASKNVLRIFKLVHLRPNDFLIIEPTWITDSYLPERTDGFDYDYRWGICWESQYSIKETHIYTSLEELLYDSESSKTLDWEEYGTYSEESSEEETVTITETKVVLEEVKIFKRDELWRDLNPAFNPRLMSDLEKLYISPPSGFTLKETLDIIKGIQNLKSGEFLAADGSGDILNDGNHDLGLYGKEKCLKSVKMIRFFKNCIPEYRLDIDVKIWVEKTQQRTNIWKWIRVGPGYHRDFDWMFLGDPDCITKTKNILYGLGYSSLPTRISGSEFDFDPSIIFKLSSGKCLNIDTNKQVVDKNADPYGFVCRDMNTQRVQEIRGYIFDYFKNQYVEKLIPGKKNKWSINFFSKLSKGSIIDFDTLEPIQYNPSTILTYNFSKMGFAILKSQRHFKIQHIERLIHNYQKSRKSRS